MENEEPKKIKFPHIPDDVIVNVEFSGTFIHRVQKAVIALCNQRSKEQLLKVYQDIADDKVPESLEDEILGMLTALIHSMEDAAREQKKIQVIETTEEILANYFTNKGFI